MKLAIDFEVTTVQNVDTEKYGPLLVPVRGHVLLKAKYKQLQMRLLANMSHNPELIKAFREGKDVHWFTVEMRSSCS